MPTAVQFRRGTTAQHASFTGAVGELTVDTDKDVVVVHDGATAGGFPMIKSGGDASLAKLDQSGQYVQTITSVAAFNIDCSAGNYFTKTISANSTFTVSNVPSSRAYAFTLELTHTSGTITWFSGVEWPKGTAPTLTTGKTHVFVFLTDNGGTRWRAASLVDYTT